MHCKNIQIRICVAKHGVYATNWIARGEGIVFQWYIGYRENGRSGRDDDRDEDEDIDLVIGTAVFGGIVYLFSKWPIWSMVGAMGLFLFWVLSMAIPTDAKQNEWIKDIIEYMYKSIEKKVTEAKQSTTKSKFAVGTFS